MFCLMIIRRHKMDAGVRKEGHDDRKEVGREIALGIGSWSCCQCLLLV